MKKAKKQKAF